MVSVLWCFFSIIISVFVFVGLILLMISWYFDWLGKVVSWLVVMILMFFLGWVESFVVCFFYVMVVMIEWLFLRLK